MEVTKGISTQVKNRKQMSKKLENHIVDINKKVTAVEWLIEQRQKYGSIIGIDLEQAKEMEKQQIIESYRDGRTDQQSERPSKFYNRMAEQYYNETFKD
jgi:hypothetical protein